jgi:hypothetical protein
LGWRNFHYKSKFPKISFNLTFLKQARRTFLSPSILYILYINRCISSLSFSHAPHNQRNHQEHLVQLSPHAERPTGAAGAGAVRAPSRPGAGAGQERRWKDAPAAQVGLQARGLGLGGQRGGRGPAEPLGVRVVVLGGEQRPAAVR